MSSELIIYKAKHFLIIQLKTLVPVYFSEPAYLTLIVTCTFQVMFICIMQCYAFSYIFLFPLCIFAARHAFNCIPITLLVTALFVLLLSFYPEANRVTSNLGIIFYSTISCFILIISSQVFEI